MTETIIKTKHACKTLIYLQTNLEEYKEYFCSGLGSVWAFGQEPLDFASINFLAFVTHKATPRRNDM